MGHSARSPAAVASAPPAEDQIRRPQRGRGVAGVLLEGAAFVALFTLLPPVVGLALLVAGLAVGTLKRPAAVRDLLLRAGVGRRPSVRLVLLGLVGSLVVAFVVAAVMDVFGALDPDLADDVGRGEQYSVGMAGVAVGAAVVEEFVFRGWMLRRANRGEGRGPLLRLSMVVSTVAFAAIHVYGGPFDMLFALLAGVLYLWLFLRSRCIWVPILVHALWNASVFLGP